VINRRWTLSCMCFVSLSPSFLIPSSFSPPLFYFYLFYLGTSTLPLFRPCCWLGYERNCQHPVLQFPLFGLSHFIRLRTRTIKPVVRVFQPCTFEKIRKYDIPSHSLVCLFSSTSARRLPYCRVCSHLGTRVYACSC